MKEKKLGRRDFLRLSAAAATGAALAGCQPQVVKETVEVEKEVTKIVEKEKVVKETVQVEVTPTPARDVRSMPNAATGMPYEIKPSINNGEPIEFDYWEWALDRSYYEIEWAQEYMNIYPNVTINVVTQGGGDHWTKMMLNAPVGEGPAFFHMHTNRLTEFCDGGFMDPMPDHVASQLHLDTSWLGFKEGAFDCPGGSGKRYFVPMGAQMPLLFMALLIIVPIKVKKSPFDVTEAHQEIVGGVEVEYSGLFYEFMYMARFLEYIFIYSFIYLFGGSSPWIGIALVAAAFLLVNLVDNATARVRPADMLKITYATAFTLAVVNIVWILL